ncbi:MAG: tRNA glutamyl-Q(34) synthetase GluQRS [Bacteroidaceae bacterium]|nr:tRNA glutamyl-Q(34) synthetase GluQRS [Bacteroidaceae bacterium]
MLEKKMDRDVLPCVGRFAPSPTGRMHLGNIFCALLSWLSAKSKGGKWLLRIEDIDSGRSRQEYADWLMDDLAWLGLEWDGEPVYQSQRSDIYECYFERLKQQELTYPCYCTRADLLATQAPHESDGRVVYRGTCRHLPPQVGRAAATRLIVPDEEIRFTDGHYGTHSVNLAQQVGDFIIRRKDGAWAYQLVVVIDDALTGVTEVVRGRDLLLSSPQQLYVARLLGFPSPQFVHLPLLCNALGQRLSKRDQSLDMESLRQRHTAPLLIGQLAYMAGLLPSPEAITASELLPRFAWEHVPCQDVMVKDLSC